MNRPANAVRRVPLMLRDTMSFLPQASDDDITPGDATDALPPGRPGTVAPIGEAPTRIRDWFDRHRVVCLVVMTASSVMPD